MRWVLGIAAAVVIFFYGGLFINWPLAPGQFYSTTEWVWDWELNRKVSAPTFAVARGFDTSRPHAVCSYELVNEGQTYKLTLNRGHACQRNSNFLILDL